MSLPSVQCKISVNLNELMRDFERIHHERLVYQDVVVNLSAAFKSLSNSNRQHLELDWAPLQWTLWIARRSSSAINDVLD
jgi:hypothetical protein